MILALMLVISVVGISGYADEVDNLSEDADQAADSSEENDLEEEDKDEEDSSEENDLEEEDKDEEDSSEENDLEEEDKDEEDSLRGKGNGKGKAIGKNMAEGKKEWEAQKDAVEIEKDIAEALKDQLEAEYEAALESGTYTQEELDAMKSAFEEAKDAFFGIKEQFKSVIRERREIILSSYTEQELEDLEIAAENMLEEDPDATVLSVDSIISDIAEFKMDTPPVIKQGRTLIPLRAISEGFGADVDWNEGIATITKGDTVIQIFNDSNIATINGVKYQIETNASIRNNRMYVPLRFILESFELQVEWEAETETIEIN
jgi:hypothetical protein